MPSNPNRPAGPGRTVISDLERLELLANRPMEEGLIGEVRV